MIFLLMKQKSHHQKFKLSLPCWHKLKIELFQRQQIYHWQKFQIHAEGSAEFLFKGENRITVQWG